MSYKFSQNRITFVLKCTLKLVLLLICLCTKNIIQAQKTITIKNAINSKSSDIINLEPNNLFLISGFDTIFVTKIQKNYFLINDSIVKKIESDSSEFVLILIQTSSFDVLFTNLPKSRFRYNDEFVFLVSAKGKKINNVSCYMNNSEARLPLVYKVSSNRIKYFLFR